MADHNGLLQELVKKLAEICLEDRQRWRANDQNIQTILAALQQQGTQIQRQNAQIEQAIAAVHQQNETILKHEGHIEALLKEMYTRREHG